MDIEEKANVSSGILPSLPLEAGLAESRSYDATTGVVCLAIYIATSMVPTSA